MNKLYVNEVFQSPQGEGFYTGRLAIFVRFAGCNLHCDFCDTKYAWEKESGVPYTPALLVDYITRQREYWKTKFIVLTGGEPMLQDYRALIDLVCGLKDKGYYVAMESNGTLLIDTDKIPLDWVTVSPKTALVCGTGNELKLLYDGTQDLEFYEQFNYKYFYLQPILPEVGILGIVPRSKSNRAFNWSLADSYLRAFEKVLKAVQKRPIWRISFQTQKLAGYK